MGLRISSFSWQHFQKASFQHLIKWFYWNDLGNKQPSSLNGSFFWLTSKVAFSWDLVTWWSSGWSFQVGPIWYRPSLCHPILKGILQEREAQFWLCRHTQHMQNNHVKLRDKNPDVIYSPISQHTTGSKLVKHKVYWLTDSWQPRTDISIRNWARARPRLSSGEEKQGGELRQTSCPLNTWPGLLPIWNCSRTRLH